MTKRKITKYRPQRLGKMLHRTKHKHGKKNRAGDIHSWKGMFVRQAYKMEMCMEEENADTNDDDEGT